MAQLQSQVAPKTSTNSDMVHENLHKLVGASLRTSQYLGLTIFSLRGSNVLYVSIRSLPTICMLSRILVSVFISIFLDKPTSDLTENVRDSCYTTETFVMSLMSVNLFISDVIYTTSLILKRNKILNFYNKLMIFIEHVSTCDKRAISIKLMQDGHKFISVMEKVTWGVFAFTVVGMISLIHETFAKLPAYQDKHPLIGALLPLLLPTFWGFEMIVRNITKLFIITILHCLKIGIILVHMPGADDKLEDLIRNMEATEELVKEFNQTFDKILIADLFTLLVVITLVPFQMIIWISRGGLGPILFDTFIFLLHCFTIFELCNAGDQIAIHVQKCAGAIHRLRSKQITTNSSGFMWFTRLIRDPQGIQPGNIFHLNRATFTAILSTLTTYLVVLLQFLSDEE